MKQNVFTTFWFVVFKETFHFEARIFQQWLGSGGYTVFVTQLISPLYCSHRKAVILSVSGKRICLNDPDYSCSVTLILCKDYSFESRSRVYAKYAIIRPELYDNPDQKNRSAYNFYWAFTSHLTLYLCGLINEHTHFACSIVRTPHVR